MKTSTELLNNDQSTNLSIPENAVLDHIEMVGYTCPILIQIRFGVSMQRIQGILDILWKTGKVLRPAKGLVISVKYLRNHPEERVKLQDILQKNLVI